MTHRFPLAEIDEALEATTAQATPGAVVLELDSEPSLQP